VKRFRLLTQLEVLVLYSKSLINKCFETVEILNSLKSLDMQNALCLTRDSFEKCILQLPNLKENYPPSRFIEDK
jgi:hypothetical protein